MIHIAASVRTNLKGMLPLGACLLLSSGVFGQYVGNFGLTARQDPATLPRSAVPFEKPVRKKKVKAITLLQPVREDEYILNGGWEMAEGTKVIGADQPLFSASFNTADWYNATVPGTVLRTLVDQGVYPDPYFGLNNLAIPDSLCRTDWWYRITFTIPRGKGNKHTWLVFNGINYRAEIWLNGRELGKINGAFRRGEFDATALIKQDEGNILAVHILPPSNPGIPHEESPKAGTGMNGGQLCLDGPTFLATEGWDWIPGIRDRDIGIWQDVRLRFSGDVTLDNPRVITDLPLPDTSQAKLTISTGLLNSADRTKTVTVSGRIGEIRFSQVVDVAPGSKTTVVFSPAGFPQLNIDHPRLWWPNGYGRPELYNLELSVTDAGQSASDEQNIRFGIREMSYELSVDAPGRKNWRVELNPLSAYRDGKPLLDNVHRRDVGDGVSIPRLREDADAGLLTEIKDSATAPFLVIKVNGQRIYCKGGNWGMDDAMKDVSRAHLEPYIRLHRDAHFNMLRNWTGESTEETLYDLCDEYGILVWNEFWLSTEGYNLVVNDNTLFLDNALGVIDRFRNHPSIALWCPRNEGYAPAAIEEAIAGMVAREDGTRYYQPNSTHLNIRPSGPWNYFRDPARYFTHNAKGFNTELGTPSLPTAETMREMMAPEDVWPISDVWYYHDFHDGQWDYRKGIDSLYGPSDNLDDFCKKAQLVNYDSHRAMFEAWNSRLWNNTTGLLLWMTHPAWPSTTWQVYAWNYATFGSYFGARKACEPVHVQMNLSDNKVVVVNTSLDSLAKASVSLRCYDLLGKLLYHREQAVSVGANRLTDCFTPEFPAGMPGVYLARLLLQDGKGRTVSTNDYWKTAAVTKDFQAFNQSAKIELNAKILPAISTRTHIVFQVENPSAATAIAVSLSLHHAETGKPVLPAYFSDSYFNLLPGEKRRFSVDYTTEGPVTIGIDGYNVIYKNILPTK
jgi:hypothetical protein